MTQAKQRCTRRSLPCGHRVTPSVVTVSAASGGGRAGRVGGTAAHLMQRQPGAWAAVAGRDRAARIAGRAASGRASRQSSWSRARFSVFRCCRSIFASTDNEFTGLSVGTLSSIPEAFHLRDLHLDETHCGGTVSPAIHTCPHASHFHAVTVTFMRLSITYSPVRVQPTRLYAPNSPTDNPFPPLTATKPLPHESTHLPFTLPAAC